MPRIIHAVSIVFAATYATLVFGELRHDLLAFVAEKGDKCVRRGTGTVGLAPECLGAPDLQSILCPMQTPSAKTAHMGVKFEIFFRNPFGDDALLYWVNEFGDEKFEMMLPAWESTPQLTYFGHVFRVRNKGGRLLLEHTVGFIPLRNEAQLANVPSIETGGSSETAQEIDNPVEKRDKSPDGVEVAFVNHAGFALKLFSYTASGDRELVLHMENDTVYPLSTHKGSELEAYTTDGRLVTSVKIGEIIVPNCEAPSAEMLVDDAKEPNPIRGKGDASKDKKASIRVDLHGRLENVECNSIMCVSKPVRTSNSKKSTVTRYDDVAI